MVQPRQSSLRSSLPRAILFSGWVPVTGPDSFYPDTSAVKVVKEMLSKLDPAGYRVSGVGGSLLPQSAAFFSLGGNQGLRSDHLHAL